ncbi:MAG: hypothetical protein LBQ58_06700 [Synergistaceae bacterium]|jgi:hypothetical protein|nr:hypothetical protein [Synergistaceae bacterium]
MKKFTKKYILSLFNLLIDITIIILIYIFCAIFYYSNAIDLREPLEKEQVLKAVVEYISPERSIKSITLYTRNSMKYLDYYFIAFEPRGYVVVVNDARFFEIPSSNDAYDRTHSMFDDVTFFEYIETYLCKYNGRQFGPIFRDTALLRFKSFVNNTLKIKTNAQLCWEHYSSDSIEIK